MPQADAIIANPIGYAHVHVAEAIGAHLHILFTMPWHATSVRPLSAVARSLLIQIVTISLAL